MNDWNLARDARLLAESQLRQLAVTEASSDLVATLDADGFLLSLNAAGRRMLQLTEQGDVARLRFVSFLTPRSAAQVLGTDIPAAMAGRVAHSEVQLHTLLGDELPASQVLVAHTDDSGNIGFFSLVLRDIRPLQAAEHRRTQMLEQLHQVRKMETVGRLAGGIAHDFNNIITVIMGYAELAMMNEAVAPVHGELNIILEAGRKASRLTSQLLEFCSKNRIEPQILDLNDMLARSEQLIGSLMGEAVAIEFEMAPALWSIEINRSQLEQVIMNLAVNAQDAMGGKGQFSMQTRNCTLGSEEAALLGLAGAGDYVQLIVSDTGCGIEAEHLEHIFEPFYTTKSRGRGTGLGLAAVYGAIHQNHGCIRVSSKPGVGTTFSIYMPRVEIGKPVQHEAAPLLLPPAVPTQPRQEAHAGARG